MEVFVLMGVPYDYELSDMLLGVYASEEEARTAYGVYTRKIGQGFDSCYVARQVVGAPAETYL